MSDYDTWLSHNPAEDGPTLEDIQIEEDSHLRALSPLGVDITPTIEGGQFEGWTFLIDGKPIIDTDWDGAQTLITALEYGDELDNPDNLINWFTAYGTATSEAYLHAI